LVMASMRLAINRSASGGMALSYSKTRYNAGIDRQPAYVAASVSAARLSSSHGRAAA
jgi:hypothetical protein